MIDLQRAYDTIDLSQAFKIHESRCKSHEDLLIVNLLTSLYNDRKVLIGDQCFYPKKGIMQGSVLSCDLFNAVLDHTLETNEILNKFISEGKLIGFADDLLGIADPKAEASQMLLSLPSLKE